MVEYAEFPPRAGRLQYTSSLPTLNADCPQSAHAKGVAKRLQKKIVGGGTKLGM